MTLVYEGNHLVFKVSGMGPYDNNGYVIADPKSKEAYLVDAPEGIESLLKEADGFQIKGLIITHTHPDHVAGYAKLKEISDIPVAVHESDIQRFPGQPEIIITGNERFDVGNVRIQIVHTPGHTPGAICLHAPGTLISGDTLFPGGPGRTESPEKFSEIVENIENKLLHYDDETMVMPGHGLDTILAVSKSEYEIFKDKTHPKGLFGHISWLTS